MALVLQTPVNVNSDRHLKHRILSFAGLSVPYPAIFLSSELGLRPLVCPRWVPLV